MVAEVAFQGYRLLFGRVVFEILQLLSRSYVKLLATYFALAFHDDIEALRDLAFFEDVLAQLIAHHFCTISYREYHAHVLVAEDVKLLKEYNDLLKLCLNSIFHDSKYNLL